MKIMVIENHISRFMTGKETTEIVARVPMFEADTTAYMAKFTGKDETFGFGRDFVSGMRHSYNTPYGSIEFAWAIENSGVYEIKVRFTDKETGAVLYDAKEIICYNGCIFVPVNDKNDILFAIEYPDEYVESVLGDEEDFEEDN